MDLRSPLLRSPSKEEIPESSKLFLKRFHFFPFGRCFGGKCLFNFFSSAVLHSLSFGDFLAVATACTYFFLCVFRISGQMLALLQIYIL